VAERPREEGHGGRRQAAAEAIWIARRGRPRALVWVEMGARWCLSGVEEGATWTGGSVTGGVGREADLSAVRGRICGVGEAAWALRLVQCGVWMLGLDGRGAYTRTVNGLGSWPAQSPR
jgi:hypothetical protein